MVGLNQVPNKVQISHLFFLSFCPGTSVAVQWLRLHLPLQMLWVRSLVGELGSHMPHDQNIKWKQCCSKFNEDLKNSFSKKTPKKPSFSTSSPLLLSFPLPWYWGSSYVRWNEHLDGVWQLYIPMTVSSPYTKSAQEWRSHTSQSILSSPKSNCSSDFYPLRLLFLLAKVVTRVESHSVLYLILSVQIKSRRVIPDALCLRSSFLLTNESYPIVTLYV